MTHDELLEHINKDIDQGGFATACGEWFSARSLFALRAVVELHKPDKYGECVGCKNRCGCYEGDLQNYNTYATCPTIQAIEKELE